MILLWIVAAALMGGGLSAILSGLLQLEAPFANSLLTCGMIATCSGFVIGTLGFVIRLIKRIENLSGADVEMPVMAAVEAAPAIATATMERVPRASPMPTHENVRSRIRSTDENSVPRHEDDAQPAFMVIQSGTINRMNYELRADGSIVARLPGRRLEFRSIDELRDYLAARGAEGATAGSKLIGSKAPSAEGEAAANPGIGLRPL